MPIYCYQNCKGKTVERIFSIGKAPRCLVLDGQTYKRSFRAEGVSVPSNTGWPMTCYASGVNAEQAGELRKHFEKIGVPTEVTADGDPIYRNAAHRRKALKARGFVDRSSFV